MIDINLLPDNLKKSKTTFRVDIKNIPVIKLSVIFVAGLFALQLLLMTGIEILKFKLVHLNLKWQSMSEERKQIDSLKKELSDLNKDIDVISRLGRQSTVWSFRLNAISDSVTPGIWLRELSIQENISTEKQKTPSADNANLTQNRARKVIKKYLSISGSSLMAGSDAMSNVGKFMNNLKSQKNFFESFQDTRLGSIQRRFIKQTEIMDFTIMCFFKEK